MVDKMNHEDAVKDAIDQAKAEEAAAEEAMASAEAVEDTVEETVEDSAEEAAETEEASEESSEETEDEASEESGKKGKFFSKKKKADPKDEKIEDLTDRLKRLMAEFDNFRKRTDKEKSSMYEVGASDIVGKILPVVDNFERGLDSLAEEEKEEPFAAGMIAIYKQLMDVLESAGVSKIEALGQEFDPNLHNAVMHVEDEEAGENTIVEEFQKGYTYRDSVIRHSMVKVAN